MAHELFGRGIQGNMEPGIFKFSWVGSDKMYLDHPISTSGSDM
ncbi:hypothetical protein J2Z22_004018 [Paenibacillus forsythiae]|uniref:Uncharacterized protein n=1 Tax=Paenibacillus forsythiae TaxID=365616 RepID=A0ABU3HC73_9BACL|nr:hypothetical protein [Paenibacillus forsythiae]